MDNLTVSQLKNAEFKLYKEGSGQDKIYVTVSGSDGSYTISDDGSDTTMVTGTDGKLTIHGLGSGIYYLEEIKAPNGYNLLKEPVKIEIIAEYYTEADEKLNAGNIAGTLKNLTVKVDGEVQDGKASASTGKIELDVVNSSGLELPEFGGMGTTIFYALGSLLLLGGLCYLVISRRKKSVQE